MDEKVFNIGKLNLFFIIVIIVMIIILLLKPFFGNYLEKEKFKDDLLKNKPFKIVITEIKYDNKSFLLSKPQKVLIRLIKERTEEGDNIILDIVPIE